MNIETILVELKFADEAAQIICTVPSQNIKSRVYMVGQVLENIPGVTLGNREPHLREKTVDDFKEELTTFGTEFASNDFLLEFAHELNRDTYELRFFKLTHIKIAKGEVILHCKDDELHELREIHQEPECE